MERLGGGATRFRNQNHHRSPLSAARLLSTLEPQSSSSTPPLELSEHDIFSTPSEDSSPSPTHPHSNSYPSPARNNFYRNNHGILAALNGNFKARSGSGALPVFNHKASATGSISSSSSTSPATSISSRIMIPRPPPPQADKVPFHHQSAPVNVPVVAASLRRRSMDWDDVVSEEEEDEDRNGMIRPPHEVVAARHSPMLACSVLEGAGRTLKGRDLRQVRNAVWRKTGFID